MPIYEYESSDETRGCRRCRAGFEIRQTMSEAPLRLCPDCSSPVRRKISLPSIGGSKSGFDDQARRAGFHKLQRTGRGEYEKKY